MIVYIDFFFLRNVFTLSIHLCVKCDYFIKIICVGENKDYIKGLPNEYIKVGLVK